jgi:DNA-directed RNA polymerase subunit RPC12/RpoP
MIFGKDSSPVERKQIMTRKISLKVITAPATGHILDAPPVLRASEHSVDYTCGHCGTTVLHAEEGQVFGLLIRCTNCGSYNATEA